MGGGHAPLPAVGFLVPPRSLEPCARAHAWHATTAIADARGRLADSDSFIQCWVYWLLGQLDDSPEVLSRFAGGYKGVQCIGAAISWALSTGSMLPSTQAWINVALLGCSLPATTFMIMMSPQLQKAV